MSLRSFWSWTSEAGRRCRNHKVKNVLDYLPKELKDQAKLAIRGAFKLSEEEGMKRLKTLASWFDRQHPVRKLSDLAGGLIGDVHHQPAGIARDTQTEPGDDQDHRESELRDSNPR